MNNSNRRKRNFWHQVYNTAYTTYINQSGSWWCTICQ